METILKKLGFKYVTATLWRHTEIGIISIEDKDTPSILVKKIYQRGYHECQLIIKTDLGIE